MLGCFKTSPIEAIEIETALLPPEIRLKRQCYRYIIRSQALGDKNPVKKLEKSEIKDLIFNIDESSDTSTILDKNHQKNQYKSHYLRLFNSFKKDCRISLNRQKIQKYEFFPPWKGLTNNINFIINYDQKECLSSYYNLKSNLDLSKLDISLYTDGSKIGNENAASITINTAKNSYIDYGFNLGRYFEVFDSELWAIIQGLELGLYYAKRYNKLNI